MAAASDPLTRLRERAAELDDMLARLDLDEEAVRADRADGTADDEHDPEGVTLSGEWQRLDAVRRGVLAERKELDEALARVEEGTYGVCVSCSRRIPAGRLHARPTATMCVECAAAAERR